jgi:hypothetical protein
MPDTSITHLQKLQRQQRALARKIRKLYSDKIIDIAFRASTFPYRGVAWRIDDYPILRQRVTEAMRELHGGIYAALLNGIEESWDLSNRKNDVLVDRRLGKRGPGVLYDPNKAALDSFIRRQHRGITLSKRVWNTLKPFRNELEQGLALGLAEGKSAAALASQMQSYLNEPDRLFRKVREEGKLVLSKAARDYHPGRGVYRSSYQNAFRLTRTETNLAYRSSDFERWKTLPFVTGIEVRTSNNHPVFDICDKLRGKYPKDFKFSGWHVSCLCHAVPVMMSDEEFDKYEDAILAGEKVPKNSLNSIKQPPAAFDKYVNDKEDVLTRAGKRPYWVQDNKKYFDSALNPDPIPVPAKPAGYVNVKTFQEAEKFLVDNGLAKTADLKGLKHIEAANDLNRVLLELKKETGLTYDSVKTKHSVTSDGRPKFTMQNEGKLTLGVGDMAGKVIKEENNLIINKAFFDTTTDYNDLTKVIKDFREKKWTTSEDFQNLVWHEAGHRLTLKNTLLRAKEYKQESKIFDYERLGKYASTNVNESLAEIYAYFKKTGQMPDEFKKLFNRWSLVPIP